MLSFCNKLLLFIFCFLSRISAQVTIARNTQVTPRCGSQLITIEINFDPSQLPGGKFEDWIVVGVSGRPECRLRGNGETKYIIEIAVFNDPCLTQIPARNVFQNRIRIGKNPVVILEDDQSITVKCVYGLPTVETLAMPIVNPNFNIENLTPPTIPTTSAHISNNEDRQEFNFNQGRLIDTTSKNTQTNDLINPAQIVSSGMLTNPNRQSIIGTDLNRETTNQGRAIESSFQIPDNNNQIPKNNNNNAQESSFFNEENNNMNILTTRDLGDSLITSSTTPMSIQQQVDEQFGMNMNSNASSRRSPLPLILLLIIALIIVLVLLLMLCLYFLLKRKKEERNRRFLIDGVSSDEDKRTNSCNWWTDASVDEYASGVNDGNETRATRSSAATMFEKRAARSGDSRVVPMPVIGISKQDTNESSSKSDKSWRSSRRSSTKKVNSKGPAPQAPKKNVPLKSNLEEFVSKTYAMGEYSDIASPAYAYTSEVYDEREVDIGFGTDRSKKVSKRTKTFNDETAVSSYRSITEIVHAAETKKLSNKPSVASVMSSRTPKTSSDSEQLLMNCVASIRGFGYRKLTEQEMGRWKNLIQKDAHLRDMLISSKSVAEIEDIFEGNEYKNLFSSTKWHEIAQCVHRALTNTLDRTNSQSQLQLFVGNVHSDW